jgi:uncharacterized membrane protein
MRCVFISSRIWKRFYDDVMNFFSIVPPVSYVLIFVKDRIGKSLKVGPIISFGINNMQIILINLLSERTALLK